MPNWCENILIVTGSNEELLRFKEEAKAKDDNKSDLTLGSLYPIPRVKIKGYLGIYAWCNEHWGTKWDIQGTLVSETATQLKYHFESAWDAPIHWLEKVAHDFPLLRFELQYDEPGGGFAGRAVAARGKLLVNDFKEYL
jgi:hypothetical protein